MLGHHFWSIKEKNCLTAAATHHGECGTRHAQTRPHLHPWLSAEGEETVGLFLVPRQGVGGSVFAAPPTPGISMYPFYCPPGHPTIYDLYWHQDHPSHPSSWDTGAHVGDFIITLWPSLEEATPCLYDPLPVRLMTS